MDKYIAYIEEQLAYFKKHSDLSDNEEVTPVKVNTTLAHYVNVGVALIGEYTRYKYQLYSLSKEYDKWHSKKFYETRKQMISEFESKTIKIAVKEIDNAVKVENETEYWKWQDKITDLELRLRFLQRLIDQWAKLDNVLNNLSKNMRQEMISLSIENRMNSVETSSRQVHTEFPKPSPRSGEYINDSKPSGSYKRIPV